MTPRQTHNDVLAQSMIQKLSQRNMTGYYAHSKQEALQIALSLIPEGSKVTKGGSETIAQIGLLDVMRSGKYNFCDREKMENKREAELFAYDADVFLASCNAITKDGILINIDGNSNRVSAITYGPKKVVFIVGMNKVCPDVDSAMKRARNEAAPINCTRLNRNTPCAKTGSCMDCLSPDTICCQFLMTRYSRHKDRIHVILVNETLGY